MKTCLVSVVVLGEKIHLESACLPGGLINNGLTLHIDIDIYIYILYLLYTHIIQNMRNIYTQMSLNAHVRIT